MTQLTLWGCLFIIFSMPLAVTYFNARQSPKLVIMIVSGAFMWLLAALATSILWVAVLPLQSDFWFPVLVSVPLQELFRWLWWKLLLKAEKGLKTLSPDDTGVRITRDRIALVSGLGFGIMSGVLQTANMLDIMSGPGMIPSRGCSDQNLFVISSVIAGMLIILHMMWGIIAFKGWHTCADMRKSAKFDWRVLYVIITHYTVALLTLNNDAHGSCAATIVPIALILILSTFVAYKVSGLKIASA